MPGDLAVYAGNLDRKRLDWVHGKVLSNALGYGQISFCKRGSQN
jgi:hypothetical protein